MRDEGCETREKMKDFAPGSFPEGKGKQIGAMLLSVMV